MHLSLEFRTNSYHGISLYGARNCKVLNNTVASVFRSVKPTSAPIRIYPHKNGKPGTGNTVRNNFMNYISTENKGVTGGGVADYNIIGFNISEHFVDFENFNFRLRSTSTAINAGSYIDAPKIDITETSRDGVPDIGAYEFKL